LDVLTELLPVTHNILAVLPGFLLVFPQVLPVMPEVLFVFPSVLPVMPEVFHILLNISGKCLGSPQDGSQGYNSRYDSLHLLPPF
jgi:hypothetical protein